MPSRVCVPHTMTMDHLGMSKCLVDLFWADIHLWLLVFHLNYSYTIHNLNSESIMERKYLYIFLHGISFLFSVQWCHVKVRWDKFLVLKCVYSFFLRNLQNINVFLLIVFFDLCYAYRLLFPSLYQRGWDSFRGKSGKLWMEENCLNILRMILGELLRLKLLGQSF